MNKENMVLSYNISSELKAYLKRTDSLRVDILSYPLTSESETAIKWKITKARGDKKFFDYIKENWYVNDSPVTIDTIKKVYELVSGKRFGPSSGYTDFSGKKLSEYLTYLAKSQDHPIIQAALTQIQILKIKPFLEVSGKIARLMSYLILYKYGYDCRGTINLQDLYSVDSKTYKKIVEKADSNMTLWLEYFTYLLMKSLEKAYTEMKESRLVKKEAKDSTINARQKKILTLFEEPNIRITNKNVQKLYKVSQITASRDLKRLYDFGFLFSHGKGRSVFYTKA